MKILKRILLILASVLAVLLITVTGALYWIFHHPKETWRYIEKKYLPADLHITWDEMSFSAQRLQGLDFKFDGTIQGLKVRKGTPLLDLSVEKVQLQASLFPFSNEAKFQIHSVKILTEKPLRVILEKSNKAGPAKNFFQQTQNIFSKLETYHDMTKTATLEIKVADLEFGIDPDKEPLRISGQISQISSDAMTEPLHFSVKVLSYSKKPIRIFAKGELLMGNIDTSFPVLMGEVVFEGAGIVTKQMLILHQQDKKTSLISEGHVNYKGKKIRILATQWLSVSLTPKMVTTELKANFSGLPEPLVKVNHFEAELRTPLEENLVWSKHPSQFSIKAPVDLFFIDRKMRGSLEKSCECKIPESLIVTMDGKVWLAHLLGKSKDQKTLLESRAFVETVNNKLITIDFAAGLDIDKRDEKYLFRPSVNGTVSVNSFQGLRRFLESKHILIPAPLSVLDGTLKLKAHGPVAISGKDRTFPLSLETNLTSPYQRVKIQIETKIKMSLDFKEFFVDVLAKVHDLQLEFPPLDPLKGKPRLTLDKRVLREPKKKPKPSSIKFHLSMGIETTKPGAIRLLSDLFHPYLPITLKIRRSEKKENSGFIQTEPFEIEYLRRRIQVEKLKLDLNRLDENVLPVDAQLQVKQTNYTVFINITGPINKPLITMTSIPYLPESEIISVLLYDRTREDLIAADAETAGGVQAAIADRAIGLFGLWAFASTPIKSFYYNPVTKIYTATLALTGDLTASIGTNWEEATSLELRKRVSKRWMLTAAWTPATQEEGPSTKLVLQWEKRF